MESSAHDCFYAQNIKLEQPYKTAGVRLNFIDSFFADDAILVSSNDLHRFASRSQVLR